MSDEIEISVSQKAGVFIIHIKGDVTAVSGEAVETAYKETSDAGARKILLHFDKDCYINSGGIAFLIGITAESRNNSQIIRITGLSDHFQKIFNMVGLTKYTEIFPSEEEALESF